MLDRTDENREELFINQAMIQGEKKLILETERLNRTKKGNKTRLV